MAEYLAQDCSDVPYEYSRLIQLSSKRIKRFHLRGTVWQSIPKDIPNFNHCCVKLQKAKQHIHMEYYIFEDDAIGRMVRDVLIEKLLTGLKYGLSMMM